MCANSSQKKRPKVTNVFVGDLGVQGVNAVYLVFQNWPIGAGFLKFLGVEGRERDYMSNKSITNQPHLCKHTLTEISNTLSKLQ